MAETSLAVLNALSILEYLASEKRGRRLVDVARALSLPPSTTQRLLASLEAKDFVHQNSSDRTYRLSWKVGALARTLTSETWLIENIRPFMQQLMRQVERTVNLAVLENNRVIPLECVVPETSRLPLYTWPGTWFPAHATALGKALLAHLPLDELDLVLSRLSLDSYTPLTITDPQQLREELLGIRAQGYATNHGEFVPEERCVAAPIVDAYGRVVAALSVTARTSELPPELEPTMIDAVKATAGLASHKLFADGKNG